MAIERLNNDSTILPGYLLEPVIQDEGPNGRRALRQAINFYNKRTNQNGSYISPIMIAGFFSAGCQSVGSIVHHVNAVALATKCSAAILTDKTKYPNFYQAQVTSSVVAYNYLHIIKQFGRWQRIAIIFFLASPSNFIPADLTYHLALQNNITVAWYHGILDFNNSAEFVPLKNSDVRVIILWVSSQPLLLQFYCMAYQLGIRGPRYIFMSSQEINVHSLPAMMSPGCTRSMVEEQIHQTFSAVASPAPLVATKESVAFDNQLDDSTKSSRSLDYNYRYMCYDSVMLVANALHSVERRLNILNMTLLDYSNFPEKIALLANDSLVATDIPSMRTGRVKFSNVNGEITTDFLATVRFGISDARETWGLLKRIDNTSGRNLLDYNLEKVIAELPWATKDGNPPKDRATMEFIVDDVPLGVFGIFIVWSLLLIGFKITAFVVWSQPKNELTDSSFKILGSIGCTMLSIGAILYTVPDTFAASIKTLWLERLVISITGLALTNSALFCRVLKYKIWKNSPKWRRLTQLDRPGYLPVFSVNLYVKTFSIALVSVILVSILTGSWLFPYSKGAYSCSSVIWPQESSGTVVYDEDNDIYWTWSYFSCKSEDQTFWLGGIAALQAALLLIALVMIYDIQGIRMKHVCHEHSWIVIGLVNSLVLKPATVIILIALYQYPNTAIAMRNMKIAVAFQIMIFVTITTVTWFVPFLQRLGKPAPTILALGSYVRSSYMNIDVPRLRPLAPKLSRKLGGKLVSPRDERPV